MSTPLSVLLQCFGWCFRRFRKGKRQQNAPENRGSPQNRGSPPQNRDAHHYGGHSIRESSGETLFSDLESYFPDICGNCHLRIRPLCEARLACGHNIHEVCLKTRMEAALYTCPTCRAPIARC